MEQREYYKSVKVKYRHDMLIIQIDLERGIFDLERRGGGKREVGSEREAEVRERLRETERMGDEIRV
jgi:hypothetical protein